LWLSDFNVFFATLKTKNSVHTCGLSSSVSLPYVTGLLSHLTENLSSACVVSVSSWVREITTIINRGHVQTGSCTPPAHLTEDKTETALFYIEQFNIMMFFISACEVLIGEQFAISSPSNVTLNADINGCWLCRFLLKIAS